MKHKVLILATAGMFALGTAHAGKKAPVVGQASQTGNVINSEAQNAAISGSAALVFEALGGVAGLERMVANGTATGSGGGGYRIEVDLGGGDIVIFETDANGNNPRLRRPRR